MPSPAGGPLQESVQSSKHVTCCCSVSQSCPTLCSPMDCSTPGSPVHHQLLEVAHKLISIESVMPNNHLIFCCPLLLLPLIFPSIKVFSDELALRIRWPPDLPLPLGVCVVAWPFWGMLSTLRWSPRDSGLSLPPNVPIISPGICRPLVHMGSTTSSDTSTLPPLPLAGTTHIAPEKWSLTSFHLDLCVETSKQAGIQIVSFHGDSTHFLFSHHIGEGALPTSVSPC